jgi:hypothetical protein
MVSVRGTDTICTIQKINYLLYRLERIDTKNQFSKIKKTSFCRRPDPRRGSGGGRRRPRPDPTEGGGGARPRGRRGGEGGRRWAPLVVVVAEVGKEGVGGCRSWSSSSPSGPKLRAAYRLRLAMPPPTASASPCHRLPPPPRQAQRPPCRRLPRRLSSRQNQRKERRERTE